MDIGNNNNQSTNNTITSVRIYGDNASPAFGGFSMICSAWIIVTNIFVLVCFVKHRKLMHKNTFTIQILTLSFNDLMAGISTLPVYITTFTTEITYEFCMFRFVLILSAQVVVLFHILGICVYRFLVVCQATSPLPRRNQGRLIVIYVLVIWIVILSLFSSAFSIWGKYRHELSICSLNEMFQENYKTMVVYSIALFTVPTVFTNVIYFAMILRLCFIARKISPVNSNSYNNMAPQPSSSNCTNSNALPANSETNRNKTDGVAHNDHSCMNAAGEEKACCTQETRDLCASKHRHSKATGSESERNVTKTSDNKNEEQNRGNSEVTSMPSFKSQRQGLVTIGTPSMIFALLALINIISCF